MRGPRPGGFASERHLGNLAAAAALLAVFMTVAVGTRWGTVAVGGSDSHCYAEQALMLSRGAFTLAPLIPPPIPWPNAPATLAPSGFMPLPGPSGASVPLCPAGLPLLMAVALKLGGLPAIFVVVPWMGALGVWCTFLIGRRLGGPVVGAASALLMACSPTFLYQLVQPMSDVPAAALWTASLAAALGVAESKDRGAFLAGVLAGAAVMVRPTLAPLAIFPVLLALPSRRFAAAAVVGLIPGLAAVAWLHAAMYGSPWRSGYGDLGALFSLSHVASNLVNCLAWLASAHTPLLAIGLLAPFVAVNRRQAWLLLAFVFAVLAVSLPYVVVTDWWHSRLLLPGLPMLVVGTMLVVQHAARRLPALARGAVVLVVAVGLGGYWISRAEDLDVFRLKALERRYVELGRYAARTLPANAVVIAAQPTGSIRFYADMPTLSWDAIEPDWLDRVLDELRGRGYAPFLAIESWEADAFKTRFRQHSGLAALDWPARTTLGNVISVYDPADRERFLAGEHIPTERVSWPVR
ncbi:MAG: glycosyltransferase family 39 protein [Acidobacteria bacterium]|nr:glycosyltransferase family 39 protein [Acidobacteriota bacterium]